MATSLIASLVARLLKIPVRLEATVTAYLLALMLDGPKKTLSHAAMISGRHKSQFSRLLSDHADLAFVSLKALAVEAGRMAGIDRKQFFPKSNWSIAIIVDATLHPRSSIHVANSQRFNHGQGFVIGHQWTNIVLFINGQLIPLPPIPFWSKNECKRRNVEYKSEHVNLAEYLDGLQLAQYVGFYDPNEVVVLTDAGYDSKMLQRLILAKGWDFVSALKSSRSAQTSNESIKFPNAWRRVNVLFRAVKKQAPWTTVRVETDQGKKRKSFRTRKLTGRIKGVHHDVAIVCSEKSTGKGRRYFACSNTNVSVGVITRAYRIRWHIELFHRAAKSQLGMLDAGVSDFDALAAHIHWVYCAYILLHKVEIPKAAGLLERQRCLQKMVEHAPMVAHVKQIMSARTQFGGLPRQERLAQAVIQMGIAS